MISISKLDPQKYQYCGKLAKKNAQQDRDLSFDVAPMPYAPRRQVLYSDITLKLIR